MKHDKQACPMPVETWPFAATDHEPRGREKHLHIGVKSRFRIKAVDAQ
jgi:hypothetical protein